MEITLKLTSDPMLDVCNNERKLDKKLRKVVDQVLRNMKKAADEKEGDEGLTSLEIYVICAQTMQDVFGKINPFLLCTVEDVYEAIIKLLEDTEKSVNDTDFLSNPSIAKKWMA